VLGSCFLKNFRSCQCTLPMGAVASGAKHGPSVGYFTWQHWYTWSHWFGDRNTFPHIIHVEWGMSTVSIYQLVPTLVGSPLNLPTGDLCPAPWRKSRYRFKRMGCGCLDLPWGLKQLLLGYFSLAISFGRKDAKAFKTMMTWTPRIFFQLLNIATSPQRNALFAESSMVWFVLFALELSDTVGGLGKDLHQTSWGFNQLP